MRIIARANVACQPTPHLVAIDQKGVEAMGSIMVRLAAVKISKELISYLCDPIIQKLADQISLQNETCDVGRELTADTRTEKCPKIDQRNAENMILNQHYFFARNVS